MNTNLKRILILIACVNGPNLIANAQTLTNFAGRWNGLSFDTPPQLTQQTDAHGLVTNIPETSDFNAQTFQIDIQTDGTFQDPEGGTAHLSRDGQGMVSVHVSNGQVISGRVNAAEDFFAGIAQPDGGHELNLLIKAPATLTTNDLVGVWNLMTFASPNDLGKVYLPTTNSSALSDLLGMDNQSVNNQNFGQIASGTMTFSADGSLSGSLEQDFAGTFGPGANGSVSLNIIAEDVLTLTGFINTSKDVLFALQKDVPNNRQEIIILTRPPASMTTADLQGAWKVTSISIPAQIVLTRNSSNFVTHVDVIEGFGLDQQAYAQGHDGFLTGVFDGIPSIGAVTVGSGGAVTVAFTNSFGRVETHAGRINAAKNTITFVEANPENYSFTILTRAPATTEITRDFGLVIFGSALCWASNTNRVLQATTSLSIGSWTNVPSTVGRHQFQPSYTNRCEFFRLTE